MLRRGRKVRLRILTTVKLDLALAVDFPCQIAIEGKKIGSLWLLSKKVGHIFLFFALLTFSSWYFHE